jgi:hypothetical protein
LRDVSLVYSGGLAMGPTRWTEVVKRLGRDADYSHPVKEVKNVYSYT